MSTDRDVSRRSVLGLLGAAGGLGLLAACTPQGGGSGSGGKSGNAGSSTVGFTGWSLQEAATKDTLNPLVDTWAKDNGATVKKTSFPYNNYLSQFTLQARGGELSGLAQVDISWLGALALLGRFTDLASVADKNGYTDAGLTSGKAAGKQVGLPWTTASIGFTANKEFLDKVGVKTPPTALDDFEEMLKDIKGLGVVPYAAMTKTAQLKDIEPWIWTFGGTIVDNGKITLGDDGSVDALTFYKKLYDQKLIAADVDRFDARALFAQRKTAMYEDAIVGKAFVAAAAKNKDLDDQIVSFPRPVVHSGDDPQALLWGHVLTVLSGDGSDKAAELGTWLTTDKTALTTWFEGAGYPPATDAGLKLPGVAKDQFIAEWTDTITKTARPGPFWGFTKGTQMDTALATQVQAVLTGQSSPQAAMKQAAADVKALMS